MTDNNIIEENKIDVISIGQADMCNAFANGSLGVISSGIVWLVSALAAYQFSAKHAIWTLLIGGVFIHPLSIILSKIVGQSGQPSKENPLAKLALEGTIFMLMCIPPAFGLSQIKPEWFFQGMLLVIGGRYLTFATIYGKKVYWLLGGALGIAAMILFRLQADSFLSALTGSLIEIIFGLYLYFGFRKTNAQIG